MLELRPQPGPQEDFLATPADIAIYGGAAFGGKTFALLLESVRHIANSGYGGVIFRRTFPQIRNEGGLWDESFTIYPHLGGVPVESKMEWNFPSGARVRFAHLQLEANRLDWQGAQIPFIGWDELTHFTEKQFFYLVSRNRSSCGVRPYIRAGCNPDPDSWVRRFVGWWIDEESGYAITERSGELRWLVRDGDTMLWFAARDEAVAQCGPEARPMSVAFIPSKITDNVIGLKKNPDYLANLKALPYVERMQLLEGNWNVRPTAGNVFRREWFRVVDAAPASAARVRYWDFAGTAAMAGTDPDWSAGALVSHADGETCIEDMRRGRLSPRGVEALVRATAEQDGRGTEIVIEQEPGSSGKLVVDHYVRTVLQGFTARGCRKTGAKMEEWKPLAAQAEAGNVALVRGPWIDDFLREAEAAPEGPHDDQVDAAAGGYGAALERWRTMGRYGSRLGRGAVA